MIFLLLTVFVNWLVIAVPLILFFPEYWLPISIAIIILLVAFAVSPLNEALTRFRFGCRPATKEELKKIESIFQEVCERAEMTGKYHPKIFVVDQSTPNAYAIGTKTVVVTKGMLRKTPSEEIAGVLAHELGHLIHGDSRRLAVACTLNQAGNVASWILLASLTLLDFLGRITKNGGVFSLVTALVALFFKLLLWLSNWLIGLGMLAVGRKEEYRADAFAKEIGYGPALASFLRRGDDKTQPVGVWAALSKTHPPTALRIKRLTD